MTVKAFMNEYVIHKCLEIMDEIRTHPISEMFSFPVDPVRDECPDYLNIITKPMDLQTIETKLRGKKYKNVHEFKEDMVLVFNNAIKYNGKTSAVGIMAADQHHLFRELAKSLTDEPITTWNNMLSQLNRQLSDHVASRPDNLFGVQSSLSTAGTRKTLGNPGDSSPEVRRLLVNSKTNDELTKLASKLSTFTEINQVQHIESIISQYHPEVSLDDGATIDLNTLSPVALHKLKEFSITECDLKNEPY